MLSFENEKQLHIFYAHITGDFSHYSSKYKIHPY